MNLNTLINTNKKNFDIKFKKLLNKKLDKTSLSKAIYYGSINGGKRIRPFLSMQSSKMAKISSNDAFIIASSIECIHSYSLIHDDLPSMDDDDFRRGKLSTHKKFNEATAILAGDALHDLAFELISGNLKDKNNSSKVKLINYLSLCIGHKGLALGQSLDLEFENKNLSKNKILDMYSRKTGKLFEFSFAAPFILKNKSKDDIKFAKEFGMLFGLIFQIIDDLIDEIGTFKKIGKTPGKDAKQGKSTLLVLIGKKEVIKLCNIKINNFSNRYKKRLTQNPLLKKLLEFGISRVD
mgnify:FL=1